MFRDSARYRRACSVAVNLTLCAGVVLMTSSALQGLVGIGNRFAVTALAVYSAGSGIVLVCTLLYLDAIRFGCANLITLIRWSLTALLAALIVQTVDDAVLWTAVALASVALLLDGVDGWLARRFSESSDFGARFDMETDAVLILVLAVMAWHFERAGIWILAAGLLRYGFVAASVVVSWLTQPLPQSRRRQAICVAQVVSLIICLVPVLPGNTSYVVAAAGLLMLSASFLIDILWAARNRAACRERIAV